MREIRTNASKAAAAELANPRPCKDAAKPMGNSAVSNVDIEETVLTYADARLNGTAASTGVEPPNDDAVRRFQLVCAAPAAAPASVVSAHDGGSTNKAEDEVTGEVGCSAHSTHLRALGHSFESRLASKELGLQKLQAINITLSSRLAAAEEQIKTLDLELDAARLDAKAAQEEHDRSKCDLLEQISSLQAELHALQCKMKMDSMDAQAHEHETQSLRNHLIPRKIAGPASSKARLGSMQRVREVQQKCSREKVELTQEMIDWSEERLIRYFENVHLQ